AASLPSVAQSVRWSGTVQAQYSENYTVTAASAGGVIVTVNGQQIINDWAAHGLKQDSGTIALSAGQTYAITVSFTANAGAPTLELM
ncbi:PA14 domain-containing protein, partial [Acinetobacter baumannii]